MELITTPAHSEANSYITLDEATNYLTNYTRIPVDSNWYDLSDNQKEYALILAAYALNTLSYKGQKIIKNQVLAFPRYSWVELNYQSKIQYNTFDDAISTTNLKTIITNATITISNNIVTLNDIDRTFSNLVKYGVIFFSGLDLNTSYYTVDNYASTTITLHETLQDETKSGVSIYLTPIMGIPENVRYAQAEMAWQVINTNIFQKDISEAAEPALRSVRVGSALSMSYWNEITRVKFSPGTTNPLDIIYLLLSDWLTSLGGRIV